MKTAMPIKPTKTALWARRIFSAPMAAETGVRRFAKGFCKNAKGIRLSASGQSSKLRSQAEKPLISDLRSLTSEFPPKFHRTEQTATGFDF
jgi:hypothetical protein